jgi:hypothetical protein
MSNPLPQTQPMEQPKEQPKSNGMSTMAILTTVVSITIGVLYSYGAARLSYNKYGSVGWAILAFIFAPLYYPFYGVFLSTPVSSGIFGSARKMKW